MRDPEGRTPLHLAAMKGHRDVVDCLLKSKASAALRDEAGKTPLYYATDRGHADVADMLRRRGGGW